MTDQSIGDVRGFYEVLDVALPTRLGTSNVQVRCFASPQSHSRGDKNPSTSVSTESGAWHCFTCGNKGGPYDAALALGRSPADAMALLERFGLVEPSEAPATRKACEHSDFEPGPADRVHVYTDEHGRTLFRLVRRPPAQPGGKKRMWTQSPCPYHGAHWVNVLRSDRRPLYNLPAVLTADGPVDLVAGEKIADALNALGRVATTAPFGESGELQPEQVDALRGRQVVVWVDSDAPGRARGARAIEQLRAVASELRGPIDLEPEADGGYDLADWIDERTAEGLDDAAIAEAVNTIARVALLVPDKPDNDDGSPFVFEWLGDTLDEVPEEPDWLWRGFLAERLITLLSGYIKTGKTTLLAGYLDGSRRRASRFLDFEMAPSGCLILTEQPSTAWKETLANFDLDIDREHGPLGVQVHYHHKLPDGAKWAETIEAAVVQCHKLGFRILVVDTYARWASMAHDHDASEILETMKPLRMAAESGLAVLIVHHNRKQGGSHGVEISGRAEIGAQVDILLSLKRVDSDESARTLEGTGRSMETPKQIVFTLGDNGFELADSPARQIEKVCRELGSFTFGDVQTRAEVSLKTVRKHVERLLTRKLVAELPKGRSGARQFAWQ